MSDITAEALEKAIEELKKKKKKKKKYEEEDDTKIAPPVQGPGDY